MRRGLLVGVVCVPVALFAAAMVSPVAAVAVGPCPPVPPEAPVVSATPLPIGMDVIDSEVGNPLFEALRPASGARLMVHNYAPFPEEQFAQLTETYSRAGYRTLLTLNVETVPPPAVWDFYVTQVLIDFGAYIDELEITNEPNSTTIGPSDGPGPNEIPDLVSGVVTAKRYIAAHGLRTRVGFNYVFTYHSGLDDSFFANLKTAATPEFLRAVDFMGLHTYPNNTAADTPVNDSINSIEIDALHTARCYMGYLGLAPSIPIELDEAGYPTVMGNSEYPAQADYWRRLLDEVYAYRANYNIAGIDVYDWNVPGYGIVDSLGNPKPAYLVIKQRQTQYNPRPVLARAFDQSTLAALVAKSPAVSNHGRSRRNLCFAGGFVDGRPAQGGMAPQPPQVMDPGACPPRQRSANTLCIRGDTINVTTPGSALDVKGDVTARRRSRSLTAISTGNTGMTWRAHAHFKQVPTTRRRPATLTITIDYNGAHGSWTMPIRVRGVSC